MTTEDMKDSKKDVRDSDSIDVAGVPVLDTRASAARVLTTGDYALGLISLAVFPAAWVFVYNYLLITPAWCFSDFCVESIASRRQPIRNELLVFYCFLGFTACVALAAKYNTAVNRILCYRPWSSSTVSFGEISWFVLAFCLVNIGVTAMIYPGYYQGWVNRASRWNWHWSRYVYETLIVSTGDGLAMLMGLCVLPTAKNSFLATFFDLPYNSLVRVHIWLGRTIAWIATLHLVLTCVANIQDPTPLINLFFDVNPQLPFSSGNHLYLMGMLAFIFLLIVVVTSLDWVRRRFYNTFFVMHLLVFVFILFAYFHASNAIYFSIPGLTLYGFDGLIRLAGRMSNDKVLSVVKETSGFTVITVKTTKAKNAMPGQFMRINFPGASTFEFHPWSVVHATDSTVTFLFCRGRKNQWSTFTADLLEAAAATNPTIHLQGPYGTPIAFLSQPQDALVFFVGGTGLAPAIHGIEFVLAGRSASPKVPQIFLFWSARAHKLEELSLLRNLIHTDSGVKVHLFDTSDDGYDKEVDSVNPCTVKNYRPHVRTVLNRVVLPVISEVEGPRVGVFICGSGHFTREALESVDMFAQGNPKAHVAVEVDSFTL